MKILVLTNEYPNAKYPKPDSPWVVPYFTRVWARQGHDVLVVVNSTKFPKLYYWLAHTPFSSFLTRKYSINVKTVSNVWAKEFSFMDEGVCVVNFPIFKLYPGGRFLSHALKRQKHKIVTYLQSQSFSPDVITGHWLNPQLQLISSLKEEYNCRTAFVFHSDYDIPRLRKFNVASYIGGIDKIGCRSHCAANILRANLNLPSLPFVCPSGVPDDYVRDALLKGEHFFSSEGLTILSVGRLVPVKKYDKLIDAANTLREIPISVKIIGDGPMAESLQTQINKIGVANLVQLVGRLSRNEVQNAMWNADVFVLIGMEVFGLVYIEAMMQGCIVIGTRGGGIDGIIVDGENGFLCNHGDANQLACIISKIYSMPLEDRKRISNNAINTAKQYSDSLVAERYLQNII